jgi:hypothetical protein
LLRFGRDDNGARPDKPWPHRLSNVEEKRMPEVRPTGSALGANLSRPLTSAAGR